MADITVCIPAYNAAGVIERSVQSIVDQDVAADVEILVCDDGSTDGTAEVLDALMARVPNLRVIRNDRNRGRPYTRNHLLDEARGRFVTWLDADDEKYPTMLSAQLDRLRRIEAEGGSEAMLGVLVYTNFHWLRPEWDEPKTITPPESDDPMEPLLDASFGGYLWLMMGLADTFRLAGPFDERLPRLQDLGFFIRFAELGGRFVRVDDDEALCIYYKDDLGRDAAAVWRSWNRVWRTYRHHYESYGMPNARKWRRHHYRVARRFAQSNADQATYYRIVFWEVLFLVRGRFRRVLFDA